MGLQTEFGQDEELKKLRGTQAECAICHKLQIIDENWIRAEGNRLVCPRCQFRVVDGRPETFMI